MKVTTAQYPAKNPYETTDKIVRVLVRKFIRMFGNVNLLPFDELNVLHGVRELYDELYKVIRKEYIRLAREIYAKRRGSPVSLRVRKRISEKWMDETLQAFDPAKKTVFRNDFERRRDLLFEAIVATGQVEPELKDALRAMTRLTAQEAITVTDAARDAADEDDGIPKVIWLTRQDERRCLTCGMLHGEIFDYDKVPDKPHRNCRCWTERWPFEGDD